MSARLKRVCGCFLVLAALLTATCFYLRASNRSLIGQSRSVGAVMQIWGTAEPCDYRWLTDTQLFACPSINDGEPSASPILFDLNTGRLEPLSTLKNQMCEGGEHYPISWALSPDRRRLVWNLSDTVHTCTPYGTDHHVWRVPNQDNGEGWATVRWLASGHEWADEDIETVDRSDSGSTCAEITGDVLRPNVATTRVPGKKVARLAFAEPDVGTVPLHGVLRRSDWDEWLTNEPYLTGDEVMFRELAVSADRRHLAWLLDDIHVPRVLAMLHRALPGVLKRNSGYGSIWISRMDGAGTHQVGSVDVTPDLPDFPLKMLQWLPSGKSVSYVYKGRLYVVSVNDDL